MRFIKLLGIELIEVSFQEKLISAIGSTIAIFSFFGSLGLSSRSKNP